MSQTAQRRSVNNSGPSQLSTCDKVFQKSLVLDLHRREFHFLLPDDEEKYRTFLGVILSLFTVLLLIGYGTYKMIDLVGYNDYKVQEN